jgi:hypothetical protein
MRPIADARPRSWTKSPGHCDLPNSVVGPPSRRQHQSPTTDPTNPGAPQSPSDAGVEGLLVHVAGQGEDGFWIVDVWESQKAVDFSEVVGPIARTRSASRMGRSRSLVAS